MRYRIIAGVFFACLLIFSQETARGQCGCPKAACFGEGIIFVINGSGDDISISENLSRIIPGRGYPLATKTIRWCRFESLIKDHKDYEAQIEWASRLACLVAAYRKDCPKGKIYLIGHSAGNHVILAAAKMLPARSVDRIILLAASVSYCYDLRPALRCSKWGIDHFWSPQDQIVSLGSEMLGTADGLWVKPAGEIGFGVPPRSHPDAKLYDNLRQYRWDSSWVWTGNKGGHYGFTREGFLDAFVMPIMLATEEKK